MSVLIRLTCHTSSFINELWPSWIEFVENRSFYQQFWGINTHIWSRFDLWIDCTTNFGIIIELSNVHDERDMTDHNQVKFPLGTSNDGW